MRRLQCSASPVMTAPLMSRFCEHVDRRIGLVALDQRAGRQRHARLRALGRDHHPRARLVARLVGPSHRLAPGLRAGRLDGDHIALSIAVPNAAANLPKTSASAPGSSARNTVENMPCEAIPCGNSSGDQHAPIGATHSEQNGTPPCGWSGAREWSSWLRGAAIQGLMRQTMTHISRIPDISQKA